MAQLWEQMVAPGGSCGTGVLCVRVVYLERGKQRELTGGIGWLSEYGPLTKVLATVVGPISGSPRCVACKSEIKPNKPCRRCHSKTETTVARFPDLKKVLKVLEFAGDDSALHAAVIDGRPLLIYTDSTTESLQATYAAVLM